jgi:HK97 family phage major capsid protein
MSVLQKLKEQKEDIHARLIELKESIGEDETFNEDQMKQWDEATKQLAEVTAKIGTRERLLSIDGSDGNPGETNFTPRVNRRQMHDLDNAMRGWTLTQVNRPNELTRQMQDARGGLAWDEPIHANVKWDQTKGVDADGGFSVNEAIVAGVIRKMKDFGGMFEACNVFTTSNGAPLKKIVRDATSFRAQKTAELGNIANTTQKQEKVVFGAMDVGHLPDLHAVGARYSVRHSWRVSV